MASSVNMALISKRRVRQSPIVGLAGEKPTNYPQFIAVGLFDVLPGENNGGGYEIRTREGLPPTR
ncbi:hypothetical protein EV650_5164 [Kribbella kalugense]|uniref:Uncharacterized protein n=1 Tax=Kribbella kalugense TaxID=2512221 RepID=A0A4R7ZMC9_9ACTN|nr:hypothetical protein EV650_5164 [Kribbella kalugense]